MDEIGTRKLIEKNSPILYPCAQFLFRIGNIGMVAYVPFSKSDSNQALAPRRDVLIATGMESRHIDKSLASGCKSDLPGISACLEARLPCNTLLAWKLDGLGATVTMAMAAMTDPKAHAVEVARRLGHATTLDAYHNWDGR